MEALKLGVRWDGEAMTWRQEWEEDRTKQELPEVMTMRELRKMADSISSYLRFTYDVGSNHKDGCVPMLDNT